jgi:hypothetical protein
MIELEVQRGNRVLASAIADDYITYATAFNGKPIVSQIKLVSADGAEVQDSIVEVWITTQGQAVTALWTRAIGSIPDKPVFFDEIVLQFDSDVLMQIKEAQTGELRIRVISGDGSVDEFFWNLKLNSPDTWIFTTGRETNVAAFSQPQHPAVRDVLNGAERILKSKGESPAWAGYQVLEAVDGLVDSVYQSMLTRDITYSEPPASWDLPGGQRIRNVGTIVEEGVATCLDSTMLFASCLENIGLYPLVVVIPGHAFVGYWTAKFFQEVDGPPSEPLHELSQVLNFVDLGYIIFFETTSICQGMQQDFIQAQAQTRARIHATNAISLPVEKAYVVDIVACRNPGPMSIRPLPVRIVGSKGETQVIEYVPATNSAASVRQNMLDAGVQGSTVGASTLDAPPVVRVWLDSLLDLSFRNPLINFRETRSTVPILTIPKSLAIIEDRLQYGLSFKIEANGFEVASAKGKTKAPDLRDERGNAKPGLRISDVATLEDYVSDRLNRDTMISNHSNDGTISRLRKLSSQAKTFQEETGSNGLYLALGSLVWTPKGRDPIRSPLVLLPVKLISKNRAKDFEISIDPSGEVTPNYSLALKLLRDESINLEKLVNLSLDESGIDIEATFEHVRNALTASKIAEFRVDEDAVLGMFNFSTYRMWKDLAENWKQFTKNSDLLKHLVESPDADFSSVLEVPSEKEINQTVAGSPISADASQALAVHQALAGKTFILQGPPGTGKSQTITNLLAIALSSGKKVLFVAEKKDALDVVKERLDSVGIGALSLDLHDKGMTPKAVREQLLNVLDIAMEFDAPAFEDAAKQFSNAADPLVQYRERLHSTSLNGESFYSAVDKWLSIGYEGETELPVSIALNIDAEKLKLVSSNLSTIAAKGAMTGSAKENPWSLATLDKEPSAADMAEIASIVSTIASAVEVLSESDEATSFFASITDLAEFVRIPAISFPEAKQSSLMLSKSYLPKISDALEKLTKLDEAVVATNANLTKLSTLQLEPWISQANEIMVNGGFLANNKVKAFRKRLSLALVSKLSFGQTDMLDFLERLKIAKAKFKLADEALRSALASYDSESQNLYSDVTREEITKQLHNTKDVIELFVIEHESGPTAREIATNQSQEIISAILQIQLNVRKLAKILGADLKSIERWQKGRKLGSSILDSVYRWHNDLEQFDATALRNWSGILEEFKPLSEYGLDSLRDKVIIGDVSYDQMEAYFRKGYYLALVEQLRHKLGFTAFDRSSATANVKRLDSAQKLLQQLLPGLFASLLIDKRGFDGSMTAGTIGELNASLKANRSKVPVRALLSKYWDQISRVTPCILASPDSVVRFLDPKNSPFDLVVFDEASQIRVPNSIGSIGRAKAAVIVGDSQQMPPTTVAQIKIDVADAEVNSEEEVAFQSKDAESILSLAQNSKVPDIMLKWHYRSADESLIAFSNKRYYKNALNTFPAPSTERSTKGLSFQLVEKGEFIRPGMAGKRGTNSAEVDAILNEISARLKDPVLANDSIGVVTFNQEQMEEVKTRLIESTDPNIQKAMSEGVGGEEIFVKNLETVQGSERDVILFSVAFSTNTKGFLPLSFGPLNNEGGQRRLNVAITRARKQVKIFCSFLPETLLRRNPSAIGVAHLAEYLQLAYKGSSETADSFASKEPKIDRIRRQVLNVLMDAGLPAVEAIGFSDFKVDIAVLNPRDRNKALLGILLDGHSWNLRQAVTDRDVLPSKMLLGKMQWPAITRVWTPNWLNNQQAEVDRILEEYREAVKGLDTPKEAPKESPSSSLAPFVSLARKTSLNPMQRLLDGIDNWSELVIKESRIPKEYLDQLDNPQVIKAIVTVVDKATAKEGPISEDRLTRLVAEAFNFSRLPQARADEISRMPLPRFSRDDEGFTFPIGLEPDAFRIWRKSEEQASRNLKDISLAELGNAMRDIAEASEGIRDSELFKVTAGVFGFKKLTEQMEVRFVSALDALVKRSIVMVSSGYVKAF